MSSDSDSEYYPSQPEPQSPKRVLVSRPTKRHKFVAALTREEREYFMELSDDSKNRIIQHNENVLKACARSVPLRFKILDTDMDVASKKLILSKYENFQHMREGSGEYFKLFNWFNSVCRLPLGRYGSLQVNNQNKTDEIASYLHGVRQTLNNTVYGHDEAKERIVQLLAQWIANPQSKGNCIGIHGSMGVGKTILVKEGICKALNLPFGFIALGGANDGSFLEGHGFTYEGSTYGKIAETLMKTQVMNPVFFFDELDKVSSSHRGDEIIGILTHLTDSSQNERFNDRYFGEIDLDLSKALIIFSYNDESLINPILKDRMTTIRVSGYNKKQKLVIAQTYVIPRILQQFNFSTNDIIVTADVIEYVISVVPDEEGVRHLKRGLEAIISWVNLTRYTSEELTLPGLTLSVDQARKCLKNKSFVESNSLSFNKTCFMYT